MPCWSPCWVWLPSVSSTNLPCWGVVAFGRLTAVKALNGSKSQQQSSAPAGDFCSVRCPRNLPVFGNVTVTALIMGHWPFFTHGVQLLLINFRKISHN